MHLQLQLHIVEFKAYLNIKQNASAGVIVILLIMILHKFGTTLGHVSNFGLKYISKQFPSIPFNNTMNHCDACHYSKQRKLPYPNSTTKSTSILDLLHADIWGLPPLFLFLDIDFF